MIDQGTTAQKRHFLIEAVGWYGVLALLAAFALISFKVISVENMWYQILNISGAIGIVIDALSQRNYQPAVLNIIWAIVGLVALTGVLM